MKRIIEHWNIVLKIFEDYGGKIHREQLKIELVKWGITLSMYERENGIWRIHFKEQCNYDRKTGFWVLLLPIETETEPVGKEIAESLIENSLPQKPESQNAESEIIKTEELVQ